MLNKKVITYFLIAIMLVAANACSKWMHNKTETSDIVIYPPPPDTTRIQYLTSISSSLDVTGNRSALGKFIFGNYDDLEIRKPYGINVHGSIVYICDTGLDLIEIIDLENNNFEYFIPSGRGQLKKPVNCFVDDRGYLYVADVERKQVVIFDSDRNFVQAIGEQDQFKPTDVFVYDNKIWVANFEDNAIMIYDVESYSFISRFPDANVGNEDFLYSPTNLFVTDSRVYVSDFGDFKIKVYTHEGQFIMSVGSYGNRIGQFVRPKGIAVDSSSNLYVVDAGFENIQIFNKDGKLLMYFGGPYKKPGDMYLPAKVNLDYNNLEYFEHYVDDSFELKYLIFVSNQYGPDKINVYGFVEPKQAE